MTDTVTTSQAPAAATSAPAPAAAPVETQAAPAPAPVAADPAPAPAPAPSPEPAAPQGAPETYASFTVPDGASMDDVGLKAFGEFAKGQNMTQEAAQAMLDKLAPAVAKQQAERLAAMRQEWQTTLKADPELGKPENQATVKEALTKFGDAELTDLLEGSGLIDHPAIARAFLKAGRAISQDKVITGRQPGHSPNASVAQRMYPNMNP